MNATAYCQTDSVRSIIIDGDTLNCLDQQQTIDILEEFALCDSYRDSVKILVNKVSVCDSISALDQEIIESLERDISLADLEIEQKDIQITSLTEINAICEREKKRLKRRQWMVGLVSGSVGALTGLLIGILVK